MIQKRKTITLPTYQGAVTFLPGLSKEGERILLNLPNSPFGLKDLDMDSPELYHHLISGGYVGFRGYGSSFSKIKIHEGRHVKIQDLTVRLSDIIWISQFIQDGKPNPVVRHRRTKIRNGEITFVKDFLEVKAGTSTAGKDSEIRIKGDRVKTPMGDISIDYLVENEIIEIETTPLYFGDYTRTSTQHWSTKFDIGMEEEYTKIGCRAFQTQSLILLGQALKEKYGLPEAEVTR